MKEKSSGIKAEISGIFPTPIYQAKLNRKFTKKELSFCNFKKRNGIIRRRLFF